MAYGEEQFLRAGDSLTFGLVVVGKALTQLPYLLAALRQSCEITLRFAPEVLPWVTYRRWPGQLAAQLENGHYRLTLRAPLNHQSLPVEVLAWIRGWGPRVEVLSPEWVRDLWLGEAEELLERYGRT